MTQMVSAGAEETVRKLLGFSGSQVGVGNIKSTEGEVLWLHLKCPFNGENFLSGVFSWPCFPPSPA